MRPNHTPLAVRIIILYRMFPLVLCRLRLLLFLVLLSAISDTSFPPQRLKLYSFAVPFTHISPTVSCPRILPVLLAMLRVYVSCCPISFLLPVLSLLRSVPFASSHCWMTHHPQTPHLSLPPILPISISLFFTCLFYIASLTFQPDLGVVRV